MKTRQEKDKTKPKDKDKIKTTRGLVSIFSSVTFCLATQH